MISSSTLQGKIDETGTTHQLPFSSIFARNGAVSQKMDGNRLLVSLCRCILAIRMSHQLVISHNFASLVKLPGGNILMGIGLTAELVRCSYQPTILVHEELMHSHLMLLPPGIDAGMIDYERTTLVVDDGRVMSLSYFCRRHRIPLVVAEEFHTLIALGIAAEVKDILTINGINTRRGETVLIRSVWFFRTENTNLITAGSRQATIAHEEIVVLAHLLNIASLARNIISAGNLLAEIGIAGTVGISSSRSNGHTASLIRESIGIVTKTIGLIESDHEDTTRP